MSYPRTSHLNGLYSELVLASTSPARKSLFTALGLPFRAESPGVDEHLPKGTPTNAAVAMLAERKARAVSERWPQALVVGADQLVDFEGQSLGKPKDVKAARAQLQRMAGHSHEILTGLCVIGPGFFACEVDAARLTLFALKDDELERYLASGEWEGCAGGYRVEGRGQALFKGIEGDRTSVQGLPMLLVTRLLREAGVQFFHPD